MKRRSILAGAAVIALSIAIGLLVIRQQPANPLINIGGAEVELLKVLPSGQLFTAERPWVTALKRVVPDSLHRLLPTPVTSIVRSGNNGITVYLRDSGHTNADFTPLRWTGWWAESMDGEQFPLQRGHFSFGWDQRGPGQINGLTLWAFPRRDREFVLRFGAADGSLVGSTTIRNPAMGPFSEWKPYPIPQIATNDGVALSLVSVSQTGTGHHSQLVPVFDSTFGNPLWAGLKPNSVSFHDVTGNEGWPLSRREPAWKIKATIYRERPDRMEQDEKLEIVDVIAPQPGVFVLLESGAAIGKSGVRIAAVSGPGTLYRTNHSDWGMTPPKPEDVSSEGIRTASSGPDGKGKQQSWGFSSPFLVIESDANSATDGTRVFCRAFDKKGREMTPKGHNLSLGMHFPEAGSQAITFEGWSNQPLGRLELLLSRPKTFEFFINPADVKTNGPAK